VPSAVHKQRAAELVASTVGVDSVIDQLAVVKEVKVIQTKPNARIIQVTPPAATETETTVIVKP
jgi:membrane glycosyltransferase